MVTAPVLLIEISPETLTGEAVADALPTHTLADGKFVPNLLLNVFQSAAVRAPRCVLEALGIFIVVVAPRAVLAFTEISAAFALVITLLTVKFTNFVLVT